jgi:hypothetical protein
MYNTSIIHVVQLLLGNYNMKRMIMELICFLFPKKIVSPVATHGHDSSCWINNQYISAVPESNTERTFKSETG